MIALSIAAALAGGLGVPQQASPQTPPPPEAQATQLEEVVVVGQSLQQAVDRFVDTVVAPPAGRGPGRWDRKVCVGAVNMDREIAQPLIDRVSEIALEVGLEPGAPGCNPNILVIATDDGPGLATALTDARPRAFRPKYAGAARSSEALERFRTTDQAVRWWHVAIPTDADTGAIAVRMPGYDAPFVRVLSGRLTTEIENDLLRAFVIVDMERSAGATLQQLSDYVAMVALAQVDPDADVSAWPTVLNVFADNGAASGLTDWDMSYLRSLYEAELNQRNPDAQNNAVGSGMIRDRRAANGEASE